MFSAETIAKYVSKMLQSASKEDIEDIARLVERYGTDDHIKKYETISSIANVNIKQVTEYAKDFLGDIKAKKKNRKEIRYIDRQSGNNQFQKVGLLRRFFRFIF
jgi:hypothetical protein